VRGRVDIDFDAHPRSQRRHPGSAGVDTHAQWNALDNFDPVAAGVLRREQLKFLRPGRADAFDGAVPLDVRVGIDCRHHWLAQPHVSHLRFFRIALDPGVIGGDQVEGGDRGGQILAGRD